MRDSVVMNAGSGGALLSTADLKAVLTESIRGSSIWAPAKAACGNASVNALAAALARQNRRETCPDATAEGFIQ